MSGFERIAVQREWTGAIVSVGRERFRHADGEEVSREKVWHPGAVGIIPIDDRHVWLTRQPREAAGLTDSLEIPAGKRDIEGEPPLETARRELGEEIGKRADHWVQLAVFFTSPGFSDERVWLYVARGVEDDPGAEPEPGERIEVVPWPLDDLPRAIAECVDSKSLIALYWLQAQLASGQL